MATVTLGDIPYKLSKMVRGIQAPDVSDALLNLQNSFLSI